MGLEFNPRKWYWQQWVVTTMLIIYLIVAFTTPFARIVKINFRTTLVTFAITLVTLYNYSYFLGAFVGMDKKRYLQQILLPPALIIFEMFLLFIVSRAVNVRIYYMGYLKYLITYLLLSITFLIGYRGIEYTTIYLTDKEQKELGIDV